MKAFGLKPSREVGDIKDWLEELILDGTLESGQPIAYYIDYAIEHRPKI
jgi:hypothetical protein